MSLLESGCRIRPDLYEHLSQVLPFEQAYECLWSVLDPTNDHLIPFDPALPNPVAHIGKEPGSFVHVVHDDKALHGQPSCNDLEEIARSRLSSHGAGRHSSRLFPADGRTIIGSLRRGQDESDETTGTSEEKSWP